MWQALLGVSIELEIPGVQKQEGEEGSVPFVGM